MTLVNVARMGISSAITFVAAIVIVVIGVAGYALYVGPGTTPGISAATIDTSVTVAPLISFSADAYASEATSILNSFSQSTGVPVAPVKTGGSFADASQIVAGAPDDVFISASLSATGPTYLKNLSSNWAIGFASDQMVLAYSNATLSSSGGAIIAQGSAATRSNATSDWNAFFTSLTSGSAKVGIADPVADPAGLRGWLALKAAGLLYSDGNQDAYVNPLLQAKANITGTHAAALVAPLESGQIQFLFIYKSAAITYHLGYLTLDRHVNLGDPTLAGVYSKVSYKDSAAVTKGAPIILCVTVPLSSVNMAEALQLVQFIVKNPGTLSSVGLQPLSPARIYHNVSPPAPISQLVSQGIVIEAGSLH